MRAPAPGGLHVLKGWSSWCPHCTCNSEEKKTRLFSSPEHGKQTETLLPRSPAVLRLTSRTWPNGPPPGERPGLMKDKFMDVEQLGHADVAGIDGEFIPSPAGACCDFIPEPLSGGAVQPTVARKRPPLHVRQRQSAHVSNGITQTSCIPRLLLVPLQAAAPLFQSLSAPSGESRWTTSGSAGKLLPGF